MKVIVTGGAGFIGSNAVQRFIGRGAKVVVIDNLSRRGGESNLSWLKSQGEFEFHRADIRNAEEMSRLVRMHANADLMLHLAAQVAVTTSVQDPRSDFDINALGTFNMLEAVRAHAPKMTFLYSSTNKVYGGMEDLGIVEKGGRYQLRDLPEGVSESRALDFHSPYGCSKGAADQYVRDYARIYGLRTVALRQSCIYGQRQFGVEDQGWLAWFSIAAVLGRPITIFGDGKQVRDVLHVEDLCDAYELVAKNIDRVSGQVFNIGGGAKNQLSLLELVQQLQELTKQKLQIAFSDWRPGDQPVFNCDIRKAEAEFGWRPRISPREGVEKLVAWVQENRNLFQV